jgi:hypothetical protein
MYELPLSHTDLDMNGVRISENVFPVSGTPGLQRLPHHIRTFRNHFPTAGDIAQSHFFTSCGPIPTEPAPQIRRFPARFCLA